MKRCLVTLVLLFCAAVAHAGEANVYLSWHAPHGQPGAAEWLDWSAGDTTKVDTLYLTFDPGEACSTLVGMTATVWFRTVGEDSLHASWQASDRSPPKWLRFVFGPDPSGTAPFPWEPSGLNLSYYTRPNSDVAGLRAVFATGGSGRIFVEGGKRYSFGQFLVRRPSAGAAAKPVCVQWGDATLAKGDLGEPHVTQGARYAGINARPAETGCTVPEVAPPKGAKKKAPSSR